MRNGGVMCNGGVIMYNNDGIKADKDMRQSVYRN